jgi:hypothetical protein
MKYYINPKLTVSAPNQFWKTLDPGEEIPGKYIEEYKKIKAFDQLLKEKSILSESEFNKLNEKQQEFQQEPESEQEIAGTKTESKPEKKESDKALKFNSSDELV